MDSGARNELNSIISELGGIISELDSIASGVRSNFQGIGNDKCANSIASVSEHYRYVRRMLNSIN